MGAGKSAWDKVSTRIVERTEEVKWNDLIIKTLNHCWSNLSWEEYQQQFNPSIPFTLTHGDFHSGNLFVREDGSIAVIDWELVCFGRGPAEVAHFINSCVKPEIRRLHER
jgi:aminoglycoside phosphotransferase (APT) family kinase protein